MILHKIDLTSLNNLYFFNIIPWLDLNITNSLIAKLGTSLNLLDFPQMIRKDLICSNKDIYYFEV